MRSKDNLWSYYEQELEFLRSLSPQFGHAHPAIAGNLTSDSSHSDPFTARLIEAIGLLNAKNHLKLDAEFSNACTNLLESIAPLSLSPVPATSIIEFIPKITDTVIHIPRKTVLTSFTSIGEPCHFTTGYDIDCLPVQITDIYFSSDKPATLCIALKNPAGISIDYLRFFIRAQPNHAYLLYELLFKHTQRIILSQSLDDKNPVILNKNYLIAEGFDRDQSLLLHHKFQHREQALLSELFHCPEKFLFFSLKNLRNFFSQKKIILISIVLDTTNTQLEKHLNKDSLALNCTPIINIFPTLSEPINITHQQTEYLLKTRLTHHPLATEIHSIQRLSITNEKHQEILLGSAYHPSPDIHHFYHPVRRARPQPELYLAFSTNHPETFYHQEWIAVADILCTNRHLVSQLPYGGNSSQLHVEDKQYQSYISDIKLRLPFTYQQDISLEHEDIIQRLLSYLLIYQSPHDFSSFQKTLQLWNHNARVWPSAIINLENHFSKHPLIHGTEVHIEMDLEKISQAQAFFICNILERYFAFQANINHYTSLTLVDFQQKEIYRSPPRCGESLCTI